MTLPSDQRPLDELDRDGLLAFISEEHRSIRAIAHDVASPIGILRLAMHVLQSMRPDDVKREQYYETNESLPSTNSKVRSVGCARETRTAAVRRHGGRRAAVKQSSVMVVLAVVWLLVGCGDEGPRWTTTSPDAIPWMEKGVQHGQRFLYTDAFAAIDSAIARDSTFAIAWGRRALLLYATNSFLEARVTISRAGAPCRACDTP